MRQKCMMFVYEFYIRLYLFLFNFSVISWKCNVKSGFFQIDITYLHDLSSKPEKPGIPDKLVWDDGWFETYGYILLAAVEFVTDAEFEIEASSELDNVLCDDVDVANDKFTPLLCVWFEFIVELLLFKWKNDATELNWELVNVGNCG